MLKFHVRGFNPENDCLDEVVTDVVAWYDRHTRLWIVQKFNKDGFQIGDALFIAGKRNAMDEANRLRQELGI